MHILVDYRPALTRRTGVGEYVHETLVALLAAPAAGEHISVFSASWKDRLDPVAIPGLTVRDVHDVRLPTRLLHLLWHRLKWPRVESLTGGTFDVVQAAHPLLIPSVGAARVVTIYDLDFLDHPERTVREIRRDYGPLAARHAQRADQVIVISRHTADDVERRLGVRRSHISICTPGAPEWQPRTGEPGRDGYILFLGTLEPRKNLEVLADAYARLLQRMPDAPRLVLAGQARDEMAALTARLRQPPFAGRVDLPGYVPPDTREALYAGAQLFVMPSHTEGFGLPAVEARMKGVPVIAARRGALVESVGAGGLLLDPLDSSSLAAAIERLLTDAPARQALAEAGLRHARQFTWRRTAAAMRDAWALANEHRMQRLG